MNTQTETTPQLTASRIKEIRQELAKMKPAKVTLDGNRVMAVKEVIFALAPALERMKKRGFDSQEIIEKLHERGIEIKPPTLAKYLNEFRRGKNRKTDTALFSMPVRLEDSHNGHGCAALRRGPRPQEKTAPAPMPTPKPDRPATANAGSFAIRPDLPLEDL